MSKPEPLALSIDYKDWVITLKTRLRSLQLKAAVTVNSAPQSDLAQQTLKDPCVFDFLALTAVTVIKGEHCGLG